MSTHLVIIYFFVFRNKCSNKEYGAIEDLPRKQILGISVIGDAFYYDPNNDGHVNDGWITGPFVYHIADVHRLDIGVECSGKQGGWECPKDVHEKIMSQPNVQEQIKKWKQQYGEDYLFFGDNGKCPIAITIHQPFVEAILRKEKKYENRKQKIFHLHTDKKRYPLPKPPKDGTKCRFCIDGSNCNHWVHKKQTKKKSNRKRKTMNDDDSSYEPPKVMFSSKK